MKPVAWHIAAPLLSVMLATGVCPAQTSQPQATTQAAPQMSAADQARLNDLVALIEGQNSPEARRTGVRELLRHQWPETPPRLAAILRGPNNMAARTAVAAALSESPQFRDPAYVEPLVEMLLLADASASQAAAAALAAYRDGGVIEHLRTLLHDQNQTRAAHLAVVDCLGMMTQREAVATLLELCDDPQAPICGPALAALERASALHFDDVAAARAWWEASRTLPAQQWQLMQLERLVRQARESDRRLQALETRLAKALRENYVRTPDAERATLLQGYLTDPSATVRLLGLEVVRSHLAEGQAIAPEIAQQVRSLLADPQHNVREAVVRTVASFRDEGDAAQFIQMLASERRDEVRRALANGLGYVGSTTAVEPLLRLLDHADDLTTNEAVTALGRLAERGVLDAASRKIVADALLYSLAATKRENNAVRERILWAMGLVSDPCFVPALVAGIAPEEAVTVRQAAAQGIAALLNPGEQQLAAEVRQALADALAPVTRDGDFGVRKAAVDALAVLAASDTHLEALWTVSVGTGQGPDAAVRQKAWTGVLRVLGGRPTADVEAWLARLSDDDPEREQRCLDLLLVIEKMLGAKADKRGELGLVRARIAAQRVALGQKDEALAAFLQSVADLRAIRSPELPRVALELLRFALVEERYDGRVASSLATGEPGLDGRALWEGVAGEIERRVNPDEVDRALAMLAAFQARPPASMPAEVNTALDQLLKRARQFKAELSGPPPASQPSSAPTSGPG
ncbi:MAG: HEAT repeat domain-containing protein [Planctomycetes bacterium]|nr:HEAT repeat domain-containing protein [Planctomycetota bacterium]